MPVGAAGTGLMARPQDARAKTAGGKKAGGGAGDTQLGNVQSEEEMFEWSRQFNQPGSDPSGAGFEQGNGATALHAAVENDHLDTVRMLLEAGVKQVKHSCTPEAIFLHRPRFHGPFSCTTPSKSAVQHACSSRVW